MRRRLPLIVLALACGLIPESASAGLIALKIEFRADGVTASRVLTLRCADRISGTVADPTRACRRLQRLGPDALLAPPQKTACTEISGGPSTARITGIFIGRPIWVVVRRDNGCEIARWQRVAFLLPPPKPPG